MLLIDKKILIVHMRKCGGTSFCRGLIDLLDEERIFYLGYTKESEGRSSASHKLGGPWKHSTANDVITKMDLDPSALEIYLISLRPHWERTASYYYYAKRHNQRNPAKYVWVNDVGGLSGYLESRFALRDTVPQYACDDEGNTLVDHFVRFKNIGTAYAQLCSRLGFDGEVIPALNQNPASAPDYKSMFSEEDLRKMRKRFRSELDFVKALPESRII